MFGFGRELKTSVCFGCGGSNAPSQILSYSQGVLIAAQGWKLCKGGLTPPLCAFLPMVSCAGLVPRSSVSVAVDCWNMGTPLLLPLPTAFPLHQLQTGGGVRTIMAALSLKDSPAQRELSWGTKALLVQYCIYSASQSYPSAAEALTRCVLC